MVRSSLDGTSVRASKCLRSNWSNQDTSSRFLLLVNILKLAWKPWPLPNKKRRRKPKHKWPSSARRLQTQSSSAASLVQFQVSRTSITSWLFPRTKMTMMTILWKEGRVANTQTKNITIKWPISCNENNQKVFMTSRNCRGNPESTRSQKWMKIFSMKTSSSLTAERFRLGKPSWPRGWEHKESRLQFMQILKGICIASCTTFTVS